MYITMLLVLFVRLVAAQTRRRRGAGLMALDFIARLLRRGLFGEAARLVSAALVSSLAQNGSPRRFAPGSNARRRARTRIELGAGVRRAIPAPPTGTTRPRTRSCPICRARRHILPQA